MWLDWDFWNRLEKDTEWVDTYGGKKTGRIIKAHTDMGAQWIWDTEIIRGKSIWDNPLERTYNKF